MDFIPPQAACNTKENTKEEKDDEEDLLDTKLDLDNKANNTAIENMTKEAEKQSQEYEKTIGLAGSQFRNFMVFESKDVDMDGAYNFEKFVSIVKEL